MTRYFLSGIHAFESLFKSILLLVLKANENKKCNFHPFSIYMIQNIVGEVYGGINFELLVHVDIRNHPMLDSQQPVDGRET